MPLSPRVPELGALELLLTVARTGSLGQAAREHAISQPAASSRLRYLERQTGLAVLERSRQGSRLTPAGAVLADWARHVVEAAIELDAGLLALRDDRDSQLRVAASLTIAEYLLPGWLVTFQGEHPLTKVSLRVANSAQVTEALRQREVDLAFVETMRPPGGLDSQPVGKDRLEVVVAPGHPWARRRGGISAQELAATPLITREAGSGTREALDRVLAPFGGVRPLLELSSTTAIKTAAATGAGPAVLSSLTVQDEVRDGRLVRCEVDTLDLSRTLRAVWPTGHPLGGPVRDLLGIAGRNRSGRRGGRRTPRAPANPAPE